MDQQTRNETASSHAGTIPGGPGVLLNDGNNNVYHPASNSGPRSTSSAALAGARGILLPSAAAQEKENVTAVRSLAKHPVPEPVSEANITRIVSSQPLAKPLGGDVDGKSIASTTTFTLDEKESLRPDDSASVKEAEEEDGHASASAISRLDSDSGARAFRDQLREISNMGSSRPQPTPISRTSPAATPAAQLSYLASPAVDGLPPPMIMSNIAGNDATPQGVPDEKLLDALNGVRDRVWVLKLEQDITDFVKDPR